MEFKLDENFGAPIRKLISDRRHDCRSVLDEGLSGSPGPEILAAAHSEGRVLVTMDHDFGNVVAYSPEQSPGVAVMSCPG